LAPLCIPLSSPLDVTRSLRAYRFARTDPSSVIEDNELWLAVRTPAGIGTIHVVVDGAEARVEAFGDAAELLLERASALVGERDRPEPIDFPDRIRDKARLVTGLRLVKLPCIMQFLLVFIVQQRVVGREASRSLRYLINKYGEDAPGPVPLRVPPKWEVLRHLGDGAFGAAGIDRKRAMTIREVALLHRRIESKWDESPEDAGAWLRKIRGIGPWTEGLVRGIVLGDADAVPVGDYHLPNSIAYALAGEPRANDDRMLELLEPYRPQRWRMMRILGEIGGHAPRYGAKRGMQPAPGWDR